MTTRRQKLTLAAVSLFIIAIVAFAAGRMLLNKNQQPVGPDGSGQTDGSTVGGIRIETAAPFDTAGEGRENLQIRLSKGQAQPHQTVALPIMSGVPLSAAEVEQILQRLPPFVAAADDAQDFRLPEDSLPPPRPGETIPEPFPVAEGSPPPETATGPLEVLRFAPEGDVPLAPFLNVTFNHPMVPLTTIEELAAGDVPVRLSPPLPGTWKWVGTKTVTFEYQSDLVDRFPMATEYVVEIPAGTESAVGTVLAETVSWKFSTPPPQLVSSYPTDASHPLDPLFFVAFDQRVDPAAVLETSQVTTADGQAFPLRLATTEEVEADETVRHLVANAPDGRWLAFRVRQPLPADSRVVVTLGPGMPSAEGPLVTQEAQTFAFNTYPPLRIQRHYCGWSNECPPLTPFHIEFNNPLDPETFDESMVRIEPDLPGASVTVAGRMITIQGITAGRTRYAVTLNGAIADIFGQTLGADESLRFAVGSASRFLTGPDQGLVTLDPSADQPFFTVYSINYERLRVRAYAVEPVDWPAYQSYLREYYRNEEPPQAPGREVLNRTVTIEAASDQLTETAVDLSGVLAGNTGHLIVLVDAPPGLFSRSNGRDRQIVRSWVQMTQIGLDAFADHSDMVVWATDLRDGAPLAGVSVQLGSATAVTAADGLARLRLPDAEIALLVAGKDGDQAILPRNTYYWSDDGWRARPVVDELRWYLFDDRQMYRPGEEVHVKGWIRRIGGGQRGDVSLPGSSLAAARYRVVGPQGNELLAGQVDVNALGGFDLAFTLPENVNLGHASLILDALGAGSLNGSQFYHQFQVQEFRRPEFEVTASNETSGPYFVGDHAVVAVAANYYAGGPLPNAEVTWQVSSAPASYTPPNWSGFIFGTWIPWWFDYGYGYDSYLPHRGPFPEERSVDTFSGVTDAAGNDYLRLDFEAADVPRPFSVMAEATVMDVNRQAWASATSLLVHPADLYVGLRSELTFVERGTPLPIETIVTDLDGNPVAGRAVDVQAARLEWKYNQGRWAEEEVDVQTCRVESTTEPVTCTFETTQGGTYRITAVVTDDQGRLNQSQFTRWVSGGQRPPAREVEQETVTLIPDREHYQPGDVARILVQAPFSPAEGLLTVSRSGLLASERFTMVDGSHTLQVPVEDGHIPNLHVQVDLVGAAPRVDDAGEELPEAPPRPAYASGRLDLSVPPLNRTLSLQVTPQDSRLEPGGETMIEVIVTGANGGPVAGAELAVVVVDEAILALSNYQLADPLAIFYQARESAVASSYGRASIILANPEAFRETVTVEGETIMATQTADMRAEVPAEAAMDMAEGADFDDSKAGAAVADSSPIAVRTNFDPLATFAPAVYTGADGRAEVAVQLPDNLTRYRVMVVAVDSGGKQFGTGESNLTARLPLMVRPSAPRFLNFGDRFELPVVVQNQTDEPMTVDLVVQATNVELTGGAGRRVTVPANDRIEVRFPVTTVSPGIARFQIAAVAGPYADAAAVELPVYTPATTEAFATYGVIDGGAIAQPVAAPEGVFPQFGGLEISTSSTALQALTDAVLYLVDSRYDSSEQLASRILAVAALRDVLTAFTAEGLPAPAEMEAAVVRDIERLQGLQNNDGGWPAWQRGRDSIPFYAIHVAHALERARLKGFAVPAETRDRSLSYLRQIENHYPHWYSERTRQTLSAYALYVRMLMDDGDPDKAAALLNEAGLDDLSLEAVAWLWTVLAEDGRYATEEAAIARHINNRAVETAAAANFTTSYGDDAYLLLHSNRRTDGIILDALIDHQPESDLIPKVVNGLLAHRTQGRWGNSQENVFILLALDRYFNTFESQTPDFVARIWLGDTYAGDHEFAGRTSEYHETEIPMSYLLQQEDGETLTQDLILSKEGDGRLYYRLGLRYALSDLNLEPLDRGFVLVRSYEAVDDPDDVMQDDDGVWHIKAGARVRVRLTLVADNRRYHVALVDPLPAGLEIVNPALAVSGDLPQDPADTGGRYAWWWWYTWYEHQNMRDERAEAFTSLLWEGVYDYSYITRATTPGIFVVPPARAEEMYAPEVFGRSGSDWVIVE